MSDFLDMALLASFLQVTCIKSGMWDNMYDTFQNLDEKEVDDKPCESSADYISIDVETTEKDVSVTPPKTLTHHHGEPFFFGKHINTINCFNDYSLLVLYDRVTFLSISNFSRTGCIGSKLRFE